MTDIPEFQDSDQSRFVWEDEEDIVVISRGWTRPKEASHEDSTPLRDDWKRS